MEHPIHRSISAVQFRRRIQRLLNHSAWGLLAAALAVPVSPLLAGLILLASLALSLIRPLAFSTAARLIDKHYRLKDRVLTSIALLRFTDRTPMEQLQIEDTAGHLTTIQPQMVMPLRIPHVFWVAVAVLALDLAVMAALCGNSLPSAENTEQVAPILSVENTARLEKVVAQAEEISQKHSSEQSLTKLSEQLAVLMSKFESADRNIRESLLTLSEMDEAFQSALNSLQRETMEELLTELAKTLELAEKTVPISKALEKGDYSRAASELRKMGAEFLTLESLPQPEQKALAEQMQAIADHAEKHRQKPMQEAAQKMSDALESGNAEQYQSAADAIADEVEKHGVRMEIGKSLAQQQMLLGTMKAESAQGNMSGGKGTDKSQTASETWGSGSAGNPQAEKETSLQGRRQQQMLTGTLGEQGNSETEMVDSQEMTAAQSLLQYQEQYQHYRRISESVLDSEPIPLGQRQVIRRYFESIRPGAK